MLEIIVIVIVAKNIGKMCRAKNVKPGWYQFLAVFLWIFMEISFLFLGFILLGEGLLPYVLAIAGAALGAIIAYQIARFAKPVPLPGENTLDGEILR